MSNMNEGEQVTIRPSESSLAILHYRETDERVFVNKTVDFARIKAVGFDMDYTIAPYNEEYEKLQFELTIKNLINLYRYPEEIKQIEYDPNFGVKGLFLDTLLGNILKIDQFGYIHVALHGKQKLTVQQIQNCYKDKTIPIQVLEQNERYYLQSTAFAAPLITLYASLIEYFEDKQALRDPLNSKQKVNLQYDSPENINEHQLNYENLFDDVNKALYLIHGAKAELKQITQQNPEKYIIKSPELGDLLANLKKADKVLFLLTNSGYEYTSAVLQYLLGDKYRKFFDYIIVDANKPSFFTGNAAFREVQDGKLSFTSIGKSLDKNKIYANGNQQDFVKFLQMRPKDMLYCGDHITGDTGATRNQQQRTLYICPEIKKEINIMHENKKLYNQLSEHEKERNALQVLCCQQEQFIQFQDKPKKLVEVQQKIDATTKTIDEKFNSNFGSIFTTTWGKTWLGQYLQENSDLYTGELVNLINYPPYYIFNQNYDSELPHMETINVHVDQQKVKKTDIQLHSVGADTREIKDSQFNQVTMSLKDYQKVMTNEDSETESSKAVLGE
ncbi:5'-nucleotidase [Hexamita inflata]|uniref:5'-nucleotidase n=1 Tax=Hexamita inflata TaxID=28002 RepID=A0ABP1GF62_9EUKA